MFNKMQQNTNVVAESFIKWYFQEVLILHSKSYIRASSVAELGAVIA